MSCCPRSPWRIQRLSWRKCCFVLGQCRWKSAPADFDGVQTGASRLMFRRLDESPQMSMYAALKDFVTWRPQYGYPNHIALIPGYHFAYGNHMVNKSGLLEDGSEWWDCPDSTLTFRLWAGGEIHYPGRGKPQLLSASTPVHYGMSEIVTDVKSKDNGNRAFVKTKRSMSGIRGDPSEELLARVASPLTPETLNLDYGDVFPRLIENRWLYFMKDNPAGLMKEAETRIPACPQTDNMPWSLTPDAALLFRFSALTYNSHAIHLDPEFTKRVYGLPGLVVQGPLTVLLMLQLLQHRLRQHEAQCGLAVGQLRISSIQYTNMAPLYVNQEIRISCLKVDSGNKLFGKQSWDIWISRTINKVWRVAVKASAKITVQNAGKAQWHKPQSGSSRKEDLPGDNIDAEESWSTATEDVSEDRNGRKESLKLNGINTDMEQQQQQQQDQEEPGPLIRKLDNSKRATGSSSEIEKSASIARIRSGGHRHIDLYG